MRWFLSFPPFRHATLGLVFASLCACGPAEKAKKERGPAPPSDVVLQAIDERPFIETRSFFGEVRAASDASLSAAEAGRVTAVKVVEGDAVKKGQVLVVLDDQMARVELSEAVAHRKETDTKSEHAKYEVERFTLLKNENVVSELEASRKVSEAETLVAEAEGNAARVARGAELVRRHRIVAPFDGIVASRRVDPGDWLRGGDVALQLLTAQHVEVDVRVPALMLDALGDVEEVTLVSLNRRAPAHVASAVNALDPRTRTALLRVTPQEDHEWLRVGAGVYVEFRIQRADGLAVPRDAIVYGVAAPRVYRVEKGKAQPVNVEIIATAGELALVRSEELALGDRLVVRGNERLRPGQAVKEGAALVPSKKAAALPKSGPGATPQSATPQSATPQSATPQAKEK